jgi:hypothetical protein
MVYKPLSASPAMQAARQQFLRVAPYQHSPDKRGHADGYKPKTAKTRIYRNRLALSNEKTQDIFRN